MSGTPDDTHEPPRAQDTTAWNPQTLIDQAPIGVVRSTLAGELLYANAALSRLLEFDSPAAMVRENATLRYKNPADREALIEELRRAGAVHDRELTVLTGTGAERIVLASTTLQGEILSTMLVDITERKRAEAGLRAHAERLEVLTEASRSFAESSMDYEALLDRVVRHVAETLSCVCLILLMSDDARWLQPAALHDIDAEALAFTRRVFATHPIAADGPHPVARVVREGRAQLIPSIDPERLRASLEPQYWPAIDRFRARSTVMAPLQAQGRTIGALGVVRRGNEQPVFAEHDLQLIQNLADRAALAIANAHLYQEAQHEIAEREQAERALEAERALLARRVAERTADLSLANAELARAARLKDEFLASMSHELRTPLNAILARTEAIEEAIYGPVTPRQVEALHGIAESGQHLLSLISDILDLSKIEAGRLELKLETLDIGLLCLASLRMVAQIALVKRITVSSSLDGHAEMLQADERRLKQILVNLLSNAVKFTPEGGKIGLEVRGDQERQAVTFTVWDTGIGIAADDLPKLFQPFVQIDSRLSRQYTGTGLGLALVLQLAQAHGGSVSVESTPGQGSRFSVTLPWSSEGHLADLISATAAVDRSAPALDRALVVEDSATAADQLARYLRELGARVDLHAHGTGATARAIALQPDVIILDILLPDEDGWEVLRQLKAEPRTRAIPVVIVSVVDEPERARAFGADALLRKPIDRATLAQTLRQATGRHADPPVQTSLVVSPPADRRRVLLAEDNQANIDTLLDYLLMKGYGVTVARNGSEAVQRAQEERPDVILMDIQMPGMDGLEATRRIRADPRLTGVPIVALTALAMPGDRERCLAAGASVYLSKPVSLPALLRMIETLLEQRSSQPV